MSHLCPEIRPHHTLRCPVTTARSLAGLQGLAKELKTGKTTADVRLRPMWEAIKERTELWSASLQGLFINRKVWVTFPPSGPEDLSEYLNTILGRSGRKFSFYESRALLGRKQMQMTPVCKCMHTSYIRYGQIYFIFVYHRFMWQ